MTGNVHMPGAPNLIPILASRKRPLRCDLCGREQREQRNCQIKGMVPRMYLYLVHGTKVCAHCLWGSPEEN